MSALVNTLRRDLNDMRNTCDILGSRVGSSGGMLLLPGPLMVADVGVAKVGGAAVVALHAGVALCVLDVCVHLLGGVQPVGEGEVDRRFPAHPQIDAPVHRAVVRHLNTAPLIPPASTL